MNENQKARLCGGRFELVCDQISEPQVTGAVGRVENLADEIFECLSHPVDFPAVDKAIIPSDTIAIGLQHGVPRAAELVNELLNWLVRLGVDVDQNVTVVMPANTDLDLGKFPLVKCTQHDDADQTQLAYLMASPAGDPIYVNRYLFDADVVIPIGTRRGDATADPICPGFCDRATAERLPEMERGAARDLVEIVNDWLGVFWEIQVVAGPNRTVQRILAGERKHVAAMSREANAHVWNLQLERPAELVVATLESVEDQNWDFARQAIFQADKAAGDEGQIVLCTRLNFRPPDDWNRPNSNLEQTRLADIFERRHIYLISELTQAEVEEIGFGFVESSDQLNRLAAQLSRCCVLRDAHYVSLEISAKSVAPA